MSRNYKFHNKNAVTTKIGKNGENYGNRDLTPLLSTGGGANLGKGLNTANYNRIVDAAAALRDWNTAIGLGGDIKENIVDPLIAPGNSKIIEKQAYQKNYSYHLTKKELIEIIEDTLIFIGSEKKVSRQLDSLDDANNTIKKSAEKTWNVKVK